MGEYRYILNIAGQNSIRKLTATMSNKITRKLIAGCQPELVEGVILLIIQV